MFLQNI